MVVAVHVSVIPAWLDYQKALAEVKWLRTVRLPNMSRWEHLK
jgi:hypothetical protein